ncbi:segregation and condensation protein A [Roseomonas xinghualingensis]|uniref:segregation and condensation protein A n=1 Tax=Roseomonas xinghualingensis TaxID=2986475 RepID=UPI0021F1C337|nr:ScpA family protein [Roseomonas sp. SXEYE001]MCV4208601.1 segregation/condensation protein A [Roseomonas sp. SXEYE001]
MSTAEPALMVTLDGFEGPLDLLLDLARAQKVDIAKISILSLVDQYLAVIEGARRVRLELAADWLVMAAWLAWLKSRLLLPEDPEAEEDAEALAGALADRLRELERMREAAAWLGQRPLLGHDVMARGAPESLVLEDRSGLAADLPGLLRAYTDVLRRAAARRPYRPKPRKIWTVQDALSRLQTLVGHAPGWAELSRFLPEAEMDPTERRAALASTLVAGLELAKTGAAELRQDAPFAPILLRPPVAETRDADAA